MAPGKSFAASALPRFETAFQRFFREYAQYQANAAAWDARWGAMYGASQPGYVAVHSVAAPTVGSTLVNLNAPAPASEVVDPETGDRVPVIPVPEGTVTTPVVQPVPEAGGP